MLANMLAELLITLAIFAAMVGLWCRIFRKAGYSRWWGLTGLVPIAALLCLAVGTWPIERRLAALRSNPDEPDEDEGYALLDRGLRLERKLHYEEALAIYTRVLEQWKEGDVAKDTRFALDGLRAKMSGEAARA